MKRGTAKYMREELKRQKRRQAELLTRLSFILAAIATNVANKQIPGVSSMSDMGVIMSVGETLAANQTLEGIMRTMEQIAKGATAAAAPVSDVIPAPETGTRQ